MSECNFSFIIPHKNIPQLLQRCIDSIPKWDDIQIIVVDDNSDPTIVNFENLSSIADPIVDIVLTKEGYGAGYARNIGLSKARGKWLLFADADDYFTSQLPLFLLNYKDSSADIIFITNNTVDCETGKTLDVDLKVTSLLNECTPNNSYDPLRYKAQPPWTKMVKRELIFNNYIRFDETPASNDVWFSVQVGYNAINIEVCTDVLYIRTVRQGSLQYSLDKSRLLSRLQVGYKVNYFLKEHGKIEYYNEIWGYLLDLRKISYPLFFIQFFKYVYKTPFFIIKKHLKYNFQRFFK